MSKLPWTPRPLTKEQCLENGGHCWEDDGMYLRHAMVGAPLMGMDCCRHCPAKRKKTENPKWTYEEID